LPILLSHIDQNDISTYGLTFGISNDEGKRTHFSSIIIEKNSAPTIVIDFEVRPTYNVLYFENFDPNSNQYISYAQDIDKIELPGLLMELSKKYFKQLGKVKPTEKLVPKKETVELVAVHQCQSCFTVYDQLYGDIKAGISSGTVFKDLPEDYSCPVCKLNTVINFRYSFYKKILYNLGEL